MQWERDDLEALARDEESALGRLQRELSDLSRLVARRFGGRVEDGLLYDRLLDEVRKNGARMALSCRDPGAFRAVLTKTAHRLADHMDVPSSRLVCPLSDLGERAPVLDQLPGSREPIPGEAPPEPPVDCDLARVMEDVVRPRLTRRRYRVVHLKVLVGRSWQEIADALGRTKNCVKRAFADALRCLRRGQSEGRKVPPPPLHG